MIKLCKKIFFLKTYILAAFMDNMTKVLIKNKLLTFQFKDTGLDKKRFDKKKKII